ncbi:MAG TPA: calcium/sodium antiporter [Candidatus Dormibacteraeota bacterium]|nr:calcium/sodium antiporter [Candidatus Dormibacteraeota bacterium]
MFWTIPFFVLGGISLYLGAEALVRGASRIAHALNVDPLLIGITVVGFGTSLPETIVSVVASLEKRPTVAVGNVIGSNIANIGLILGLTAAVPAPRRLVKREVLCMLAATAVFYLLSWRGRLDRIDGLLLLGGLVWFTASVARWTLRESTVAAEVRREAFREYRRRFDLARDLAITLAGILALVLGGGLLVRAVVALARTTGVSELALSTTIVAVGGSLPELATSVVATRHQHSELLLGNLVGSNVFNILGAMGAAALFRPLALHVSPLSLEFLALLVFSAALPLLMWREEKVSRIEGTWLLAGYCIFIVLLFAR